MLLVEELFKFYYEHETYKVPASTNNKFNNAANLNGFFVTLLKAFSQFLLCNYFCMQIIIF